MRAIGAEQVLERLDYPTLVQGLHDLHRENTEALEDLLLEQPSNATVPDRFFMRAAWQRGQALGVKAVTIFPGNDAGAELPTVQGVYLLFEGRHGRPVAAINGTALTWRKTAADSALGARFLAREDVATLLMVGAGAMAPELIKAHVAIRPTLRRVLIWNRTPERAARLAAALPLPNIDVELAPDLESAAHTADLICCATATSAPLIRGAWLKPGAHLDLVGAYTPVMREADDDALRRARIFVDARATTLDHIGELMIPLANGVIARADIQADLYDLCRGRHPGRQAADEITLFKNGGGGHLDLMTARVLAARLELT
ncbi:MAG: ornithine cyclodeaminase [Gammaproteobacteria bacterium]